MTNMRIRNKNGSAPIEIAEAIAKRLGRGVRVISTSRDKKEIIIKSHTIPFGRVDVRVVQRELGFEAELAPDIDVVPDRGGHIDPANADGFSGE